MSVNCGGSKAAKKSTGCIRGIASRGTGIQRSSIAWESCNACPSAAQSVVYGLYMDYIWIIYGLYIYIYGLYMIIWSSHVIQLLLDTYNKYISRLLAPIHDGMTIQHGSSNIDGM